MNPARRRALRGTLGDIARATRKAGTKPEAFLDELILFVDHAAREEGVDRHALAAQERAAQANPAQTSATMETGEERERLDHWADDPEQTIKLGLRLIGLGVGVAAGGLVLFFLVTAVIDVFLFMAFITGLMCFVIGPLLLLTGLVLLIIGRVRRRRDAKEALGAEDEALLELIGPDDPLSPLPA